MGRKKTHSREELLARSMEIFRDHGFAGTSVDMLVAQIGVSRYSLYAEFGNMQGIFEAALDLYNNSIIELRFGPLEQPEAGLKEIRDLLDFYGAAGAGPAVGRGCLLCNTAIEFGPQDPTGNAPVQRYFKRLSGAFTNALENARQQGDLPDQLAVGKEADLLTSVILGLFVLIRAKAPPSTIEHAASLAKNRLEEWTADTP